MVVIILLLLRILCLRVSVDGAVNPAQMVNARENGQWKSVDRGNLQMIWKQSVMRGTGEILLDHVVLFFSTEWKVQRDRRSLSNSRPPAEDACGDQFQFIRYIW